MIPIARTVAMAAALAVLTGPCFAQALDLNPYGLVLDPYHVFPPGPPTQEPTLRHRRNAHLHRAHHGRVARRADDE